ncbi:MAG: type II toxin-antitoxin system YafQ family toxin [Treponema sp.]|jgi:mRNA interferase YafQ|nr:type II toxin-antitoxin system YafQ family toxin [Treponema sp.]
MLTFTSTSQYRRERKLAEKRGRNISLLNDIINTLLQEKPLAPNHRDHPLSGDYAGFRECHVQPDWLLIYTVDKEQLVLTASRTGTHADLF